MTIKSPGVIVLGYNRFFETTDRCLASLFQDPKVHTWDVLLVDNGSDEASRKAFVEAQARYPGVRLFRIERNAGFPGGMNAGLRLVQGDPIFLVSSDVLVPAGTIGRLSASLRDRQGAGLISPVTNTAGNEQRIFIDPAQPVAAVMEQGRAFAEASDHGCVSAYRLDYCCVGMSRAAYETIGGFDESFSPGYYEDFDHSLRAKKAGFDLLVAENAFVYHEGGGTFGTVSKEKKALIERNKRRFIEKHGSDVPLPHVRDTNLSVLAQYAGQIREGSPPPAYRIANRLKLGHADMPRSIFKRWRYRRRLAAVEQRLAGYLESAKPK